MREISGLEPYHARWGVVLGDREFGIIDQAWVYARTHSPMKDADKTGMLIPMKNSIFHSKLSVLER